MVKLEEKIKEDLNKALKNQQELLVSTLRFLLSEIYNAQTQKQKDLSDEEIFAVIRRQIKQREEAIPLYQKGGRHDLADKEKEEQRILSNYLPQEISSLDLEKMVSQIIEELGVLGKPETFGQVMGAVMAKVKGRAEGKQIAEMVKNLLAKDS
jgi:hypothetical protein